MSIFDLAAVLGAGMLVSPHGSLIQGKDATMRQGSVGLDTQASSGSLASSLLSHVHRVPLVCCNLCHALRPVHANSLPVSIRSCTETE